MIVKIGNKLYDSAREPIMIVLDSIDKDLISNMGEQKIYCRFPEGTKQDDVEKFIDVSDAIDNKIDLNKSKTCDGCLYDGDICQNPILCVTYTDGYRSGYVRQTRGEMNAN